MSNFNMYECPNCKISDNILVDDIPKVHCLNGHFYHICCGVRYYDERIFCPGCVQEYLDKNKTSDEISNLSLCQKVSYYFAKFWDTITIN